MLRKLMDGEGMLRNDTSFSTRGTSCSWRQVVVEDEKGQGLLEGSGGDVQKKVPVKRGFVDARWCGVIVLVIH